MDETMESVPRSWSKWHQSSLLAVLKLLCMTVFSDRKCPESECDKVIEEKTPVCEHFIAKHSNLSAEITSDSLSDLIINCDSENYTDILHHSLSQKSPLFFNMSIFCLLFSVCMYMSPHGSEFLLPIYGYEINLILRASGRYSTCTRLDVDVNNQWSAASYVQTKDWKVRLVLR